MSLIIPLILLLLTGPLVVKLLRANELFALRVEGGRGRLLRGRLPRSLEDDLLAALKRAGVERAELRGVVEDGRPQVYVVADEPASRALRQQLRNTISLWSVPKIRNAPKRR